MTNLDKERPQDKRIRHLTNGEMGLIIRIQADGNCLFRSVLEGLRQKGISVPDDHGILRGQVIQELRKELYIPVINATLSDELAVGEALITEEDRAEYLNRMDSWGSWGGTPEVYALANLFQTRIAIHEGRQTIIIPHELECASWPIHVELVHESVDEGLELGAEDNINHYNLVLPESQASELIGREVNNFDNGTSPQSPFAPSPALTSSMLLSQISSAAHTGDGVTSSASNNVHTEHHEDSVAGTVVETVAKEITVLERAAKIAGKHVPHTIGKIGQLTEIAGTVLHNDSNNPTEQIVCGTLSGVVGVVANSLVTTAIGIASGAAAAVTESPIASVPTAIGVAILAQPAVDAAIEPLVHKTAAACSSVFQAVSAMPRLSLKTLDPNDKNSGIGKVPESKAVHKEANDKKAKAKIETFRQESAAIGTILNNTPGYARAIDAANQNAAQWTRVAECERALNQAMADIEAKRTPTSEKNPVFKEAIAQAEAAFQELARVKVILAEADVNNSQVSGAAFTVVKEEVAETTLTLKEQLASFRQESARIGSILSDIPSYTKTVEEIKLHEALIKGLKAEEASAREIARSKQEEVKALEAGLEKIKSRKEATRQQNLLHTRIAECERTLNEAMAQVRATRLVTAEKEAVLKEATAQREAAVREEARTTALLKEATTRTETAFEELARAKAMQEEVRKQRAAFEKEKAERAAARQEAEAQAARPKELARIYQEAIAFHERYLNEFRACSERSLAYMREPVTNEGASDAQDREINHYNALLDRYDQEQDDWIKQINHLWELVSLTPELEELDRRYNAAVDAYEAHDAWFDQANDAAVADWDRRVDAHDAAVDRDLAHLEHLNNCVRAKADEEAGLEHAEAVLEHRVKHHENILKQRKGKHCDDVHRILNESRPKLAQTRAKLKNNRAEQRSLDQQQDAVISTLRANGVEIENEEFTPAPARKPQTKHAAGKHSAGAKRGRPSRPNKPSKRSGAPASHDNRSSTDRSEGKGSSRFFQSSHNMSDDGGSRSRQCPDGYMETANGRCIPPDSIKISFG